MALAYWIARSASEQELISNYNIIIEKSYWPPLVIAGVLGATFSSALASMVGSSRILFAMGQHRVLAGNKWLSHQNKTGEPRNAMMVTGILVFTTMLLRDLNAIAPLVTMFFLITYAMLNVVVIIEQRLGLISFRPIFNVHRSIPWIGVASSVLAMFIINPTISLISVAVVIVVYGILSKRDLETPFEDVRSGLFVSFAEWAAKHTSLLSQRQERAWKPNLLVPVIDPQSVKGIFSFVKNIAYPKGSIKLMGIGKEEGSQHLSDPLMNLSESFQKRGVFASWTVINTDRFADGVNFGNQALRGAFFKPNIIFLNMAEGETPTSEYREIIREAARLELGVLIYLPHFKSGFGQRQMINIWIRDRGPKWEIEMDIGNLDLSILVAYKLKRNWNAQIRLITVVDSHEDEMNALNFMVELVDQARLPSIEVLVKIGDFRESVQNAPTADLNIFGLVQDPNFDFMHEMVETTKTTCLFILDSGHENVLA
jgi:hypothetical protein